VIAGKMMWNDIVNPNWIRAGSTTLSPDIVTLPSAAAAQALAFVRNMTAMTPPLMKGSRTRLGTTVRPHQISA
jgi:hypothetical protein